MAGASARGGASGPIAVTGEEKRSRGTSRVLDGRSGRDWRLRRSGSRARLAVLRHRFDRLGWRKVLFHSVVEPPRAETPTEASVPFAFQGDDHRTDGARVNGATGSRGNGAWRGRRGSNPRP